MNKPLPKREFSKSKMSMYLRTLCERELYLSLFSNNPAELEKAGLPIPLKSRPGVQLITASGRAFEYEQFNVLCSALPNNVFAKNSGAGSVDLLDALSKITTATACIKTGGSPYVDRQWPDTIVMTANTIECEAFHAISSRSMAQNWHKTLFCERNIFLALP